MLSAQEFIEKVISGGDVRNQHIDGFVLLEHCEIKQMDWSGCTFNSSVEINYCILPVVHEDESESESNIVTYESIDLNKAKIEGRLQINECKFGHNIFDDTIKFLSIAHEVNFNFEHIAISRDLELKNLINIFDYHGDTLIIANVNLNKSTIGSGLHVVNSKELRLISILAVRSQISGSIEIIGNLKWLNLESSNIASDVRLELDAFKLKRECKYNISLFSEISLQRATITGDFACMISPDYYNPIVNEDDIEISTNVLQISIKCLDLYRASVGRDFYLGSYKDESSKNNGKKRIACHVLSLSGCIVNKDITIVDIEFVGPQSCGDCSEEIPLNLSNTEAFSLNISRVQFELESDIQLKSFCSISNAKILNEIDFSDWIIQQPISPSEFSLITIDASNLTSNFLKIENVKIVNDIDIDIDSEFDNTKSNIHPIFNLNSAAIGLLNIKQTSSNRIIDASIGAWKFDPPNETADNYINMLNLSSCVEELDLKQCIKIEQHLENIGKRTEADKIHLYWRREEQKKFKSQNEYFKYIISKFWDSSLRFGLSPLRPLYVLFLTILLSSYFFIINYNSWVQLSSDTLSTLNQCGSDCEKVKNELALDALGMKHHKSIDGKIIDIVDNKNRIINSIFITVSSSTPIIDIGAVKHLEPKPKSGGYWLIMLLKIMGWIVWPLFLTAFVPMILPKNP